MEIRYGESEKKLGGLAMDQKERGNEPEIRKLNVHAADL